MKVLTLKDRGDFLSTRFLGEIVRREIEVPLKNGETVGLDFQGVTGMSHSFADECFGILLTDRGQDLFRRSLEFVSLSDESKSVLRFVLADRSQTLATGD